MRYNRLQGGAAAMVCVRSNLLLQRMGEAKKAAIYTPRNLRGASTTRTEVRRRVELRGMDSTSSKVATVAKPPDLQKRSIGNSSRH
jgi:hypothetical protein